MCRKQLSGYAKTVLIIIVLFMGVWSQSSLATWTGGYGFKSTHDVCATSADTDVSSQLRNNLTVAPMCSFDIGPGNSVPANGQYSLVTFFTNAPGDATYDNAASFTSNPLYIEADQQLSDLPLDWTGISYMEYVVPWAYICYALRDMTTNHFYKFNATPTSCTVISGGSLPPEPSKLECSFNNGNALNISLGDVVRSEIGAAPGSTPALEQQLDVTCTGDGTATYSINFQYTGINISGNELVTTSANGLAVAMSFNDQLVTTTDTYTRTYSTGSQSESLKFELVRNPTVKVSDIPTGAFSASAVMVITFQ
ncbi:hypothetical protein ELK40_12825 [Enterobacter sp. N18-03635]|uniref:fimbrial protein n=1 Tax=Enterobacter sp. N18-03635 TaxID=2500132 RepID=UPI000FD9683C|nr:fimbrial protein [Enterobacter sp. N18-03635]AZV05977.1 hypothetical protein ELK40_12825 [Enterobacter sp. N18-03635]